MKKIVIAALLCTSLLVGEDLFFPPLFTDPSREELILPEEDQSKFFYAAGGINPFPTVSLGVRTIYGHFGSDLSLSASLVLIPVPGLVYKQLFFAGKDWQECKQGHSAFYLGPQVGVYISGSPVVGAGAFLGLPTAARNLRKS